MTQGGLNLLILAAVKPLSVATQIALQFRVKILRTAFEIIVPLTFLTSFFKASS